MIILVVVTDLHGEGLERRPRLAGRPRGQRRRGGAVHAPLKLDDHQLVRRRRRQPHRVHFYCTHQARGSGEGGIIRRSSSGLGRVGVKKTAGGSGRRVHATNTGPESVNCSGLLPVSAPLTLLNTPILPVLFMVYRTPSCGTRQQAHLKVYTTETRVCVHA